jgi:uncharacterized protein
MADNLLTIPKTPVLDKSEDYEFLRKEGLKFIEKLSGKIWTDYNLHDPGITTHELLCYAITDLGYRTSFSIPDLLAADRTDEAAQQTNAQNFFTASQILPVNSVSETDIRKVIMDVPGIKNAWLNVATDFEQPVYIDRKKCELTLQRRNDNMSVLPITGLYTVIVQFEDDDGKKEQYDAIIREVWHRLMQTRNLCEDYLSITQVQYEDIAVCSDIEVKQNANVTKVQAQIFQILIDYFSPPVNYYTLEQMIEKGKTIDEIFEGPLLQSGFIDDEELLKSDLRTQLHTSDLYNLIMDIPEVVAVKSLKLIRYVNDEPVGEEEEWILDLGGFRAARLEKDKSKFLFYKGFLPYMANKSEVAEELKQLQEVSNVFRKKGHDMDLAIPEGKFRNITNYFPIQNDFPLTYGIGPAGLPQHASAERQAQAMQHKAYLLFFEQLLTDYLAQLANIRKLFSYEYSVDRDTVEQLRLDIRTKSQAAIDLLSRDDLGILSRTYFAQELSEIDKLNQLLANPTSYKKDLLEITETPDTFNERRNRFLDHLLARFCESMTEYSLTLYQMYSNAPKGELLTGLRVIADKEALLHDYPKLSRDRSKGFNYKTGHGDDLLPDYDEGIWNTENIAGMKLRVARLLGMRGDKLNQLLRECLVTEKASFYTVAVTVSYMVLTVKTKSTMLSEQFLKHIDAYDREFAIWTNGTNAANFLKVDNVGEFYYQLVDPLNGNAVLATSEIYTNITARNKALTEMIALFASGNPKKATTIRKKQQYKVALYDKGKTNVLLEVPTAFTDEDEAMRMYDAVLFSGQDIHAFQKGISGDKYFFRLLDSCNHKIVLAVSPYYLTIQERDEKLAETVSFFSEDRLEDVIRRRTLGTTFLDIEMTTSGSDKFWCVKLFDEANPMKYLLKSEDEDTIECAESIMLYMLHNGDNPTIYKVYPVGLKFSYVMYDDCENPIATGDPDQAVATEAEAQQLINCVVRFFRENCDIENFHLVEHILLRPRINLDSLLPACVSCEIDGEAPVPGYPRYTFEVYPLNKKLEGVTGHTAIDERIRDIIRTQKSRRQIKSRQKADDLYGVMLYDSTGRPVLHTEGYVQLNSATNAIASIRYNGVNTSVDVDGVKKYNTGSDNVFLGNYRIFFANNNYHFHLYADNAQVIASSAKPYNTKDAAIAAIRELVSWFAFEDNIFPEEKPCPGFDEDPYSFRISVVLPAWPSRFRSQYFRKYVERVIRLETPAHIYPRVCWIDLDQMRTFEYHYHRWLQSLAANDLPNPHTVRQFAEVLTTLKNIYPVAVLHSCEDVSGDEPQVILDNTMLGNL